MDRVLSSAAPGRPPVPLASRAGARNSFWTSVLILVLLLAAPDVTMANGEADTAPEREFYFTRGIYGGTLGDSDWGPRWAVDYPKADQQFLVALHRLTVVDAFESEHSLSLGDPALGDFPFLYVLEVGSLSLSETDVKALRRYLLAGGFMVVDDFWGTWAWDNFEAQMQRVFPGRPIVEVPLEHPIFHAFYDVSEIIQVPNVHQASGGKTWEYDGRVPHVRGIFDDEGRLMVAVNWNTDLGDAWEWADLPSYPLRYSTYALKLGINFVIYAMTY